MGPKKKGKAARTRYMIADFTREEKNRVTSYCRKNHTTISAFLATLALEDVYRASRERPTEEAIDITLRIPAEQSAKLQMFARRQGKTVNEYVAGLVTPTLAKGKTSFSLDTETLRYYLSPEEHRLLKAHLKSKNVSARTYVSYLALKALERRKKK